MSKEISLFKICDHYITEDLVQINSDYRTITIPRTIGNQKSFSVKRNGFDIDPTSKDFGFGLEKDPDYIDQYGLKATPDNSQIFGAKGQRQILKFDKRQKSNDDFFELSYYTTLGWCPKCNTLSVYFDWVFDDFGRFFLIQNEEKLIQDAIKGTLTVRGSNTYHTWYGTILDSLIGGKIANFNGQLSSRPNMQALIGNDVTNFLNNLKDLQDQQSSVQEVTDKERIEEIILIYVQQNPKNPDLVEISIKIRNRDKSKDSKARIVEITRVIDKNNRLRVTGNLLDPLKNYLDAGTALDPNTVNLIY